MNGIHDLGGMHGFGPVEREEGEPLFHAEWERRVFGMLTSTAIGIGFSIDEFRSHIENMGAAHYLETSYYEHWLHAIEVLTVLRGGVSADELAAGHVAEPGAGPAPLQPEGVPKVLAHRLAGRVDLDGPAPFAVGDRVRARNLHPEDHTRLPRYVRGHVGRIDRVHGGFVFPDTVARRAGDKPQFCYSVRFDADELWGPDAGGRGAVYVDLFDDYLEPADPDHKE